MHIISQDKNAIYGPYGKEAVASLIAAYAIHGSLSNSFNSIETGMYFMEQLLRGAIKFTWGIDTVGIFNVGREIREVFHQLVDDGYVIEVVLDKRRIYQITDKFKEIYANVPTHFKAAAFNVVGIYESIILEMPKLLLLDEWRRLALVAAIDLAITNDLDPLSMNLSAIYYSELIKPISEKISDIVWSSVRNLYGPPYVKRMK